MTQVRLKIFHIKAESYSPLIRKLSPPEVCQSLFAYLAHEKMKPKCYSLPYHSLHKHRILEMFVRMLTVHCDQNDSYEITINGYPVEAEMGMFAKLSTSNLPNPM